MVLLLRVLISFYGVLVTNGLTMGISEAGISQVSLAASHFERAQSLSFDVASIDTFINNASMLTDSNHLGIESTHIIQIDSSTYDTLYNTQNDLSTYDDFDDFNGTEIDDSSLAGSLGTFHTSFKVYYVDTADVNTKVNYKTFLKRLDMKIWRVSPPGSDTLRASKVLGYFHFD